MVLGTWSTRGVFSVSLGVILRRSCSSTYRFMVPSRITAWAVVIYERQQRFNQQNVSDLLQGMRQCAKDVGIAGFETNPVVSWENGQGVIADQLRNAGMKCKQATGQLPSIIVCILPEGATDIYNAIKQYVWFHWMVSAHLADLGWQLWRHLGRRCDTVLEVEQVLPR